MKWESLYTRGNKVPANAVEPLFQVLMQHGELELKRRAPHGWQREAVRFTDPSRLRRELGIPEPDEAANELAERRAIEYAHPALDVARQGLDGTSPRTALARLEPLDALQKWHDAGRNRGHVDASRLRPVQSRQYQGDYTGRVALARGAARSCIARYRGAFTAAADRGALQPGMAARHAGPCGHPRFHWPAGRHACLDRGNSIASATMAASENRTAFEKVVTSSQGRCSGLATRVSPSWWRDAMSRFLKLAPAAAMIACDPDPDGIAIALQAGALWSAAGPPNGRPGG